MKETNSPSKEVGVSMSLHDSGVLSPTTDVVQEDPSAWDWRIVTAFIAAGVAALYLL